MCCDAVTGKFAFFVLYRSGIDRIAITQLDEPIEAFANRGRCPKPGLIHSQFLAGSTSNLLFLEFLPKKIHCIDLRFGDTFHVNIHRDAYVAVPQNCLSVLVCHSELV